MPRVTGPNSHPEEEKATKYVVARSDDIPPGARLIVELGGRSVGIFNVDGRYYAILNRCPHRGAALCNGDIIELVTSDRPGEFRLDSSVRLLACPWHGWEYDLETGQSWLDARKAKAFKVTVETGGAVAKALVDGAVRPLGESQGAFIEPLTHRVKGPYVAEVIPVAVENEYIVVTYGQTNEGRK